MRASRQFLNWDRRVGTDFDSFDCQKRKNPMPFVKICTLTPFQPPFNAHHPNETSTLGRGLFALPSRHVEERAQRQRHQQSEHLTRDVAHQRRLLPWDPFLERQDAMRTPASPSPATKPDAARIPRSLFA